MKQLCLFSRDQSLSLIDIQEIFTESYRELRLGSPCPRIHVEFYPFVGINHTIRLRNEELRVRLSDLLTEAPEPVIKVLSIILLAKLYRRRTHPGMASSYHAYINSLEMKRKAFQVRRHRGRKLQLDPKGRCYDLRILFEKLNGECFNSSMGKVVVGWSRRKSRRILGHFDPSHNSITISRIFDGPEVPEYVISYILFHEMLHARLMTPSNFDLRNLHSAQFKNEEKRFKWYQESNDWLKSNI
jgi:SprT-like family